MANPDPLDGLKITDKLVFDLQLALYLDLVSVLEHTGVVSYRQMAARVLNLSLAAREEGDTPLGDVLEGIAGGFAGQGDGMSIGVLKVAGSLRDDEAMGDVPSVPGNL